MLKVILVVILVSQAIACTKNINPKNNQNLENAGDLLIFSEVRGDQAETTLRMIITKKYLRIDEGIQSEDFMLYDRKSKAIYNVIAEDKSIMELDTTPIKLKADFPILWNVESQTSNALVKSDNKNAASATYYYLKLNQKSCYNMVVIDQGMEEPLAAIREYRQALAEQLKNNYHRQVGEECFEAVNIFTPLNHLHEGFPIREWSSYGYQRFLVDYRRKIIFPKRLFELPNGYSLSKI